MESDAHTLRPQDLRKMTPRDFKGTSRHGDTIVDLRRATARVVSMTAERKCPN